LRHCPLSGSYRQGDQSRVGYVQGMAADDWERWPSRRSC